MARSLALGALGVLVAFASQVVFLYVNSLEHMKAHEAPEPFTCPSLDESAALGRFRRLITFPSVSNASSPNHVNDPQVFRDMLAALEESFPLVWKSLRVEEVGTDGLSRLLTWPGSRPELPPALFVSHYDVVPVTPGTEGAWKHPPFSGALEDGFVWGRGSADIKFSVASLLEAATELLRSGFQPTRTLMFAFGHDEEVGGELGAGATSRLLQSRGVELDVVVDEGGVVLMDGMRPFTKRPVALVATAEKGYATVDVVLRSPGGHSSMPPTDGSDILSQTWRLSTALKLLPSPPALAAPVTDMMRELAPYATVWMRLLLASCDARKSWLVNRLLGLAFHHVVSKETAALSGDTLALTRVAAGVADNVLPQEAVLRFNGRVMPGRTGQVVVERLRSAARWAGVEAEVKLLGEKVWPGSNVTSASGRHYRLLKRAIQETWRGEDGKPAVAVAPFLLTGGTDSKHYGPISRGGILRFVPYGMNKTAGDLGLLHSTNERIRADYFPKAVCSYIRILELFAGSDGEGDGSGDSGGGGGVGGGDGLGGGSAEL